LIPARRRLHPSLVGYGYGYRKGAAITWGSRGTLTASVFYGACGNAQWAEIKAARKPKDFFMEQSSQSLLDSAYKKIEAGDYNGARHDFRDLTGIVPKDALDYVNQGLAYNGLGDYEKANEDYEKAKKAYEKAAELETDPENKIALFKKCASISGLAHAASCRAVEAGKREIKGEPPKNPDDQFNPKDKWDYYCRAIENKYFGKTDKAISDINRAIEIDNDFFYAHKRLGNLYYDIGDFTRAINAYHAALLLNPDNDEIKGFRAQAYHLRGIDYIGKAEYDKAIEDFTESIRQEQKNAFIVLSYGNRAIAHYQKGDWNRAIEDFSWVITNSRKDEIVYFNRGSAYEKKSEWDKAIVDYTEAVKLNSNNADTYDSRGTAYTNKGDYDKAIADYAEAIRLDPSTGYYRRRGVAYSKKGDYEQAITDFNESLRLDPKNATAFSNRGDVYKQLGDKSRAIADYNSALSIDPNNADARRGIEKLR
jgi:tetratricopeptide (TPR) repeat protein